MQNVPFQKRKSNTTVNTFQRGLERNGKNRNVLEFDVEKDGGIIFCFVY